MSYAPRAFGESNNPKLGLATHSLVFKAALDFGNEQQVFAQGLFEIGFNDLPHGSTFFKCGVAAVICAELVFELVAFMGGGNRILRHDIEQCLDAVTGGSEAKGHEGPFFGLVLFDGIFVEVFERELHESHIFFKELGEI